MAEIVIDSKTYGTHIILVDNDDYDIVRGYTWALKPNLDTFYALTNIPTGQGKYRTVYMHRLLTDPPKGMVVDHINGNGLDNRRSNIRVCTPNENKMNRKLPRHNTSGYKGVRFIHGKWYAYIGAKGKRYDLGKYETPQEAAAAYNSACKLLHGVYSRLNNILSGSI